ncbi:hypothetical protein B0H10DRAFT_2209102 [Mycena sp. CBHHK59/15]|nr:hypothetical protein B0H10DRAFT_2209102 [Mycena sp. CBHHK59/15]
MWPQQGSIIHIGSQVKFALRENVEDVLKSNFARFSLKVETAMHEIKDALDSGPHDLLDDGLSGKNWRLGCKCRHFVDAVYHHYAQKFGKYTLESGEPHSERWTLK